MKFHAMLACPFSYYSEDVSEKMNRKDVIFFFHRFSLSKCHMPCSRKSLMSPLKKNAVPVWLLRAISNFTQTHKYFSISCLSACFLFPVVRRTSELQLILLRRIFSFDIPGNTDDEDWSNLLRWKYGNWIELYKK